LSLYIGTSTWRSEERAGSGEEPQKNHHTRRGDRREEEKYISFQCINIVFTVTPEAHDGLDEKERHPMEFWSL
jgi:hypothetical protein